MNPRSVIVDARNRILRGSPRLQSAIRAGARGRVLPAFVWTRLQPFGEWELSAPDGTKFVYHSSHGDGLGRAIVWTDMRDWELGTQRLLFALAKRTEYFLDVGSYSGIYSILACIANPRLRSIAVEPNPASLEKLRKNVEINGLSERVTIVEAALSNRSGSATLSIPRDVTAASLHAGRPDDEAVTVSVTTGDEAVGATPIGLIKMDVEGFEPEVLLGMERVLASTRPAIIAECLHHAALRRLRATASDLGYRFAYQIRPDRPIPIDNRYVHRGRGGGHNYLFSAHPVEDLVR